jgi:hypothetical protein
MVYSISPGGVPDVFPVVVSGIVPGVLLVLSHPVLYSVTPNEPKLLSSRPTVLTNDNIEFTAVHSPLTRKPHKKALVAVSPKITSTLKSSSSKYVFLDDPTKTMMFQLNHNDLPPVINNNFLCTGNRLFNSTEFKMSERTTVCHFL